MEPVNICVVGGAGYVGLVTGLGFAEIGNNVINVDIDQKRIHRLQNGGSPIYEEGILPVLRRNLDAGRIQVSSDLRSAVASSQVIFIAVGTPSREDGQADLSQVIQVAPI
jgi:UDPglucose 6-dehydrogenase